MMDHFPELENEESPTLPGNNHRNRRFRAAGGRLDGKEFPSLQEIHSFWTARDAGPILDG
jgi:hypothetical protein